MCHSHHQFFLYCHWFHSPAAWHRNKWYLSQFSSITWNERESHYSQAKIKIYSLWHALQAYWLYIIGIKNIQVEINVSYIKGMLNNPDIQPGHVVNRWIIRIKVFQFKLVHVP